MQQNRGHRRTENAAKQLRWAAFGLSRISPFVDMEVDAHASQGYDEQPKMYYPAERFANAVAGQLGDAIMRSPDG